MVVHAYLSGTLRHNNKCNLLLYVFFFICRKKFIKLALQMHIRIYDINNILCRCCFDAVYNALRTVNSVTTVDVSSQVNIYPKQEN